MIEYERLTQAARKAMDRKSQDARDRDEASVYATLAIAEALHDLAVALRSSGSST